MVFLRACRSTGDQMKAMSYGPKLICQNCKRYESRPVHDHILDPLATNPGDFTEASCEPCVKLG